MYLYFHSFVAFCVIYIFFFFKQKTAYEMRISDWSSDVCSSDLPIAPRVVGMAHPDMAAAGLVVGVERAQQRRLAATRRAVERPALPGRHLEAETREDRQAVAPLAVHARNSVL